MTQCSNSHSVPNKLKKLKKDKLKDVGNSHLDPLFDLPKGSTITVTFESSSKNDTSNK